MSTPLNDTRSAVPVLVVVLGLAASLFTFSLVSKAERKDERDRFQQRAERAAGQLEDVVRRQLEVLRLLQGYYPHAADGEAAALLDFLGRAIQDDESFSPLASVAWVRRVQPGDLAAFERDQRRRSPQFAVHGLDGEAPRAGDDDAGNARDHWIVEKVEPQIPGGLLHGLDLGDDRACLEALERAVHTGREIVSGPTRLSGPSVGGAGVIAAFPVYADDPPPRDAATREKQLRGVVVGLLSLDELLARAFATNAGGPGLDVHLRLDDGDDPIAPFGPAPLADSAHDSAPLDVPDRRWSLLMWPAEETRRTTAEWLDRTSIVLPPAIFVVMCLVSWIVWSQQRQTVVIREQVARQTTELRQKNLVLVSKERELEDANRRLLEMSNTDALTGILNRRAFEVQLDKERDRSRRSGTPFGLLLFDIDGFKDYNDRYGHPAGDEVLRTVAQLIANEARRIDCVARYGGEEFVILASGSDAQGLMALGERVRQRIQQAGIENSGSPHGVVTISGGGALSSATDGGDPRPVIDLADRCLYQAKTTGRNRVVMVM